MRSKSGVKEGSWGVCVSCLVECVSVNIQTCYRAWVTLSVPVWVLNGPLLLAAVCRETSVVSVPREALTAVARLMIFQLRESDSPISGPSACRRAPAYCCSVSVDFYEARTPERRSSANQAGLDDQLAHIRTRCRSVSSIFLLVNGHNRETLREST